MAKLPSENIGKEDGSGGKWKCRICGCVVESVDPPVCSYNGKHGYMDPIISLSLLDHHNIDYGKTAQ